MIKAEQRQMVWIELYLAVVKCCEEDCSAHCDAFAVERRNHLGSVTRIYNTSGTAVFLECKIRSLLIWRTGILLNQ